MEPMPAAQAALRATLRAGADEADAFVSVGEGLSVEVERGAVKTARANREGGVGIRAYVAGALGFAYANQLRPEAVRVAARSAVAQARAGTPDPDFHGLPGPARAPRVAGLYDGGVASVDARSLVADLAEAVRGVRGTDPRIHSIGVGLAVGHAISVLANSRGVERSSRETGTMAYAEVVTRDGNESSTGTAIAEGRRLRNLDLDGTVGRAVEWSLRGLATARIGTETLPLVLDPMAVASVLGSGLAAAVNGEEVLRRRSYLAGREGEAIAVPGLEVVDDATIPGGPGSYPFDGEGTPGRRTPIVRRGVLRGFLYDAYTAGKAGVPPTGNALREGGPGGLSGFRSIPAIGPSNLIVAPGKAALEDLVGDVRRGLYVRSTGDRPNLATGEFSGLASEGYLVEDGSIVGGVRETTFAFDMVGLMKGIEAISRDQVALGGLVVPGLLVGRARVTGPA